MRIRIRSTILSMLWKRVRGGKKGEKTVVRTGPRLALLVGFAFIRSPEQTQFTPEMQKPRTLCGVFVAQPGLSPAYRPSLIHPALHLTANLSTAVRDAIVNNPNRDDFPVSERSRLWLESAFLSLLDFFGKENIQERQVLTPDHSDFPIQYNGKEEPAHETLRIIATQMEVPFDSIQLCFYDDQMREISTGSPFGGKIYLESRNRPDNSRLWTGFIQCQRCFSHHEKC